MVKTSEKGLFIFFSLLTLWFDHCFKDFSSRKCSMQHQYIMTGLTWSHTAKEAQRSWTKAGAYPHARILPVHALAHHVQQMLQQAGRKVERQRIFAGPRLRAHTLHGVQGGGDSSQWRICKPPPAVWALAVAHMGRRYSSTPWPLTLGHQWILSSATHPFTVSNLPFFPSSHFPRHPLWWAQSREWGDPAQPGFATSLQAGLCCTHPTKSWQQPQHRGTGLARAPAMPQSPAQHPPTQNSLLLA